MRGKMIKEVFKWNKKTLGFTWWECLVLFFMPARKTFDTVGRHKCTVWTKVFRGKFYFVRVISEKI